ncbi:MAG: ribosome-associated translation inhibitor RaiA [Chloroflexi bacterium]|nr:ribosome-associated translation inhibitor RaiA [Chloroflexota bacterium]
MGFRVHITSQGFDLDQKFQDYVEEKTNKLGRYLEGIQEAHVDLKYSDAVREFSERNAAQISIHGKGYSLRAEEHAADMRSAFDLAQDKMKSRITRYKGKHFRAKRDSESISDAALREMEAQYEEQELPQIGRRKKLHLLPMDEDEAIEQMKLLDHEDFFIFFNMETSAVNLLYLRRDGSYGLIETELA